MDCFEGLYVVFLLHHQHLLMVLIAWVWDMVVVQQAAVALSPAVGLVMVVGGWAGVRGRMHST